MGFKVVVVVVGLDRFGVEKLCVVEVGVTSLYTDSDADSGLEVHQMPMHPVTLGSSRQR